MTAAKPAVRAARLLTRLRNALQLQRWTIERVQATGGDEAIHDLRVALRRASALARIGRGVPPGGASRALQEHSRDLRRALSLHRSQEVTAAILKERFARDPKRRATARVAARRILGSRPSLSALAGPAFVRKMERLRALFDEREGELARLVRPGNPSAAALEAAARLDRRAARRLLGLGNALIDAGLPDRTTLHAFRIASKRLRYTLEFLEEVVPGAPSLLRTLRQFQDLSGDAHDRMEVVDAVKGFAARSRPGAPIRALIAPLEADTRKAVAVSIDAARGLLEQLRNLLPAVETPSHTKGSPPSP
jgi:CHAD domain-containing protein